jgi:DNA-binding NtrC family response regulator
MYNSLKEIKDNAVVKTLLNCGCNQSKAAQVLGISRGALRMALERYTLDEEGESLNDKALRKYMRLRNDNGFNGVF